MISVVKAEYMGEYKIYLEFNKGKTGEVDFKEIIKHDHRPISNQLKDISIFKHFKIDFDTLVWPNERETVNRLSLLDIWRNRGCAF